MKPIQFSPILVHHHLFLLIGEADVLIHTGDFTNKGTKEEFEQFNRWLGAVKGRQPQLVIVVIVGNHDVYELKDDFATAKKWLSNATYVPAFERIEVFGICLLLLLLLSSILHLLFWIIP
jgi:3',5'-cyclic AMP phosphodiesterase CpdA